MQSEFVTAVVDLRDMERGLVGVKRAANNPAPMFRAIRPALRIDQADHGRSQEGPMGRWPARSRATLAEYAKRGKRRPPRPLGKLLTAVEYKSTSDSVIARSKVPWSGAQQDGDRGGHGAKIPARPFLWMSEKFLAFAEEVFARAIGRAFGES